MIKLQYTSCETQFNIMDKNQHAHDSVLAVSVTTVHRLVCQNKAVTKSSMSLKWRRNLSAAGGSNSLNKEHNTQRSVTLIISSEIKP